MGPKNWVWKKFCVWKNVVSQKNVGSEKVLVWTHFGVEYVFGSNKIAVPKILGPKDILGLQIGS